MGKTAIAEEAQELPELVGDIVDHFAKLIGQQVDLLRAEVKQQLERVAAGAAEVAAGGGLAALGGIMSGFMLAHLLHKTTGLPLWASYGAVAAACGAAGAALLRAGTKNLAGVTLVPQQTAEALGENLTWLKNQVTPSAR